MQKGLNDWCAAGAAVNVTYYLVLLAETLGEARRFGDGLAMLAKAEGLMRETGERYYEAEVHRLRGEFLRMQTTGGGRAVKGGAETRDICRRSAIALEGLGGLSP